jgi:hypothetical protein
MAARVDGGKLGEGCARLLAIWRAGDEEEVVSRGGVVVI